MSIPQTLTPREQEVLDCLTRHGLQPIELRTLTHLLNRVSAIVPKCYLGIDDLQDMLRCGLRIMSFSPGAWELEFDSKQPDDTEQ
jgi:hypothetical protein